MKSNNIELTKAIKKEFDFNSYEIEQDKLIEISNIIDRIFNGNNVLFGKFIDDLHVGKLGMWYKAPVSFLSVANKYIEMNNKPLAR